MHAKYLDFIPDLTIKQHITIPDATKQQIKTYISSALLIWGKAKWKEITSSRKDW